MNVLVGCKRCGCTEPEAEIRHAWIKKDDVHMLFAEGKVACPQCGFEYVVPTKARYYTYSNEPELRAMLVRRAYDAVWATIQQEWNNANNNIRR